MYGLLLPESGLILLALLEAQGRRSREDYTLKSIFGEEPRPVKIQRKWAEMECPSIFSIYLTAIIFCYKVAECPYSSKSTWRTWSYSTHSLSTRSEVGSKMVSTVRPDPQPNDPQQEDGAETTAGTGPLHLRAPKNVCVFPWQSVVADVERQGSLPEAPGHGMIMREAPDRIWWNGSRSIETQTRIHNAS